MSKPFQRPNESEQQRRFRGWWIPLAVVEQFDARKINAKEALLLAIVDSFSDENNDCFMTNERMGSELGVGVRRIAQMVSNCKEAGLLEEGGYDGRRRHLRTTWYRQRSPHNDDNHNKSIGADPEEVASQGCNKFQVRPGKNCTHIIKSIEKRNRSHGRVTTGGSQLQSTTKKRGVVVRTQFDLDSGGMIRSTLIRHDSDLTRPSRGRKPAKVESFADQIARLRLDRGIPEDEIRETLEWMDENYDWEFCPTIRKVADIYDRWEAIRRARRNPDAPKLKRKIGRGGWSDPHEDYENSLEAAVSAWCADNLDGVGEQEPLYQSEIDQALVALGEEPGTLKEGSSFV